ncbi:MAG TPA: efflux RND transporter permease subunit [Vicinamibacterales bacterium]|nr:efflux RND transporter permease subunit [Vicinamibacterales bacterium]
MTRLAIEKNRITAVALAIVIVGGVWAYTGMSRAEDPGFIIRTAQVLTLFPGASPERVEDLVTDTLEEAIQEIPELDFIASVSKTGVSIVMVNIREEFREMRPIWDDLRRKVDRVRPELPENVVGPTVNDEFGDVFGIVITLTGAGFSYAELKSVADDVRDALLRVGDVAKVDIYGAQEERVFVDYDNARLAEFGLSPLQLQQILQSANIIIPGGNVSTGVERIVLEPSGNFESIDDLRRTVVTLPGRQQVVYLEDLAQIYRGYIDPPSSRMRASGVPALGLAISMRDGGNIITLGEGVSRELERLQAAYPIGIEFDVVAFQPEIVDRKVDEFVGSLLQAVVIVLVVLLLFLGLRTGLVVAALVPMAMLMALLVMSFLGIGLDQMSLASLIIALGMLVDNAIVMAESIMVQMSEGRTRVDAAIDSASELRIPLLISSLTTAAAFLPIFLARSSTGEYTAPLFKVVTITLLSSWVLALTMTPLLCVLFLRVKAVERAAGYETRFYRVYRGVLLAGLRHRAAALAMVAAVFALALQGLAFVPNVFFPPSDKAIFTAEFELPSGTSIERTEQVVREIDAFIARDLRADTGRRDGVTNWATFIGRGGPRFYLAYNPEPGSPDYAFSILNATSRTVITGELIPRIEAFCLERFPDVEVTLNPLQLGPPVVAPVQVRLSGRDPEALFDIVERVKTRLRAIEGTKGIQDDWGPRSKKLLVRIDQPRARRAGVTNQDIAISLQTALSGFETTQFREEDELIPVSLRSSLASQTDVSTLMSLNVYAQATGQSVPLLQVADVDVVWEAGRIRRRNRLKTVTVSSELQPGATASPIVAELRPWLEEERRGWALGYLYEFGGEEETSVEANQSIGEQVPIGGFIILLLLIVQFNSIRRTLIILLTIPLGLIGVVIGLIVAQSYFGFMTLLGIIALAGIVINNAIVLIDRIGIEIETNGLEPARAVLEASQRRLRPILLTTATTVAGLLPLWFGGGPMWEPMAIAIIFGLIFATVLTLGVVPILYSLFFRVDFRA